MGKTGEGSFDFADLNSEASNFDLFVDASKKLYCPVRTVAGKVARAIHPLRGIGGERRWNKSLRRKVRSLEIAPRQSRAFQIKFPNDPYWNDVEGCVQNIGPGIRYWSSYR